MKSGICSNSIYLSTCDNLMIDRNYTVLMAKLAAAQFQEGVWGGVVVKALRS